MADEVGQKSSVPLPPKLDLRRSGILKGPPAPAAESNPPPGASPTAPVTVVSKPVAGPTSSSSTMHITLSDDNAGDVRITAPASAPATVTLKPVPSPSGSAASSTTMHIKLQDEIPTVKIAPVPVAAASAQSKATPTIEIKKPQLSSSASATGTVKPLVVSPAPAASVPPPSPTAVAEKKLSSKSETSRIPLELATAISATPGKPTGDLKTIRIKPSPGTLAGKPAVGVAPVAAVATKAQQPTTVGPKPDDKRKTSRISLEAALAIEDKGADANAPKTIRLKKPGETAAKVSPTIETIKAQPASGKPAMSQTARLDEPAAEPEEEEGTTPTRRKTIKVKRPSDRPGINLASGGAEAPATASGAAARMDVAEEKGPVKTGVFDWIAIAAALLTIIMTFVVMFMLASQAWGPNPCLTELSSWKTGPNFSWGNKVPPLAQ